MPNYFNSYIAKIGLATINLNTDVFKIALSNTAPSASNSVLGDITQISAGFGYTSGGTAIGSTAYSQTAGVGTMTGGPTVTFTASGGSIGPFQYAILYSDTASGDPLVAYLDLGSAVTLADGGVFTLTFPSSTIQTATKSS